MSRSRHPKKEVEAALRYAERHGWTVEQGGSHAWGKMICPTMSKDCRCGAFCISGIHSTPRDAGTHATQLRRVVDKCTRKDDGDD